MDDQRDPPLAQQAYDALAEAYAALVDNKPHNAAYERPATLSLLPDVKGKRVLDAGCGPGVYAEWLVAHGAEVVALDANDKMVALARQRLQGAAEVLHANLERPLDFLPDGAFDLVLSPLVMDYVRDWAQAFGEFHRVLRQGGHLIFSMEHPQTKFDARRANSNYFEVEVVALNWRGFGTTVRMPSYRRPWGQVLNPLISAGFVLERILEPLPTAAFRESLPEDYETLTRSPGFLCIRAVKA